ncbi:MAG: adenosine deaminase [Deltaproteobacteria bacterium]|nr:adenosine deaminase [Deltaproteobacteria bacterium]
MRGFIESLPKVELHVHLEGSIPLQTLFDLVKQYGGDASAPTLEALQARFRYRDFPHFIETWVWKNRYLREYSDFERISEAVAREFVRRRITYAEVFYSPPDFARQGLKVGELTTAIRRGLDRAPLVTVRLIADVVRDYGPLRALSFVEELAELRSLGVVGIGLGGSEQTYPPEPFEAVFERARRLGLRTTAHAGEAAGPESIWGAIDVLRVDRIGHGTRAIEDAQLVAELVGRRIPIEACLTSNVLTGAARSFESHPARELLEQGAQLSLHTDDPAMFGCSIDDEYENYARAFGASREEILQLLDNAIAASWMSDEERVRHRGELIAAASR